MGQGAHFSIELPATEGPRSAPGRTDPSSHLGHGKVLVMDDDSMVSQMLAEMLKTLGYDSVCFAGGEEALRFFVADRRQARVLTAVFLDLTVPGAMGGLETLEGMRGADGSVPFFVVSGFSEDPVLANPEAFGFSGGLRKPFLLEDVRQLLARRLGNKD